MALSRSAFPIPNIPAAVRKRLHDAGWTGRARTAAAAIGPALLFGTSIYLFARPALALFHELFVFFAASLLSGLGALGAAAVVNGQLPLDPVYTGTMFLMLADVQVTAVVVAPPLGDVLHGAWPSLFGAPDLVADGAWASALVQPGASVIARGLVMLATNVLFLSIGLLLVGVGLASALTSGLADGRERGRRWLAVFGTLLQSDVIVNQLVEEPVSLVDLEATGLTYGFSVLFTGPAAERPRLSVLLSSLPDPVRDGVLALGAVGLAYGLALALICIPLLIWRLPAALRALANWRRLRPSHRARPVLPKLSAARIGVSLFSLALVASPVGSLAEASSRYLPPPPEPEQSIEGAALDLPKPADSALLTAAEVLTAVGAPSALVEKARVSPRRSPASGRPSVVVTGSNYNYSYRVGGHRKVIRGMGYNPTYSGLPTDERAARFDRDFAAMRETGVNVVLGWVTEEFDQLLLDKAYEHGLGVILPYHLDPALDYTRPEIREAVAADVLRWVGQYKDHPALRMWGLGNEVLHKLVYPSWMKLRGDPIHEARADAFAAFYVRLIDQIHAIDPGHPVTYRDAEEAYLPRLRQALNADGVRRPWFVYGINIYNPRLAEVVANWPKLGLDAALLISEFGPGGAGPNDRPRGYREMWAMIRAQSAWVLGGAPYVWTTQGPEEVDRIFGLVDASGQPVDGSLATIGRLFRGEATVEVETPPEEGFARQCDERVGSLVRRTIQSLQANPKSTTFQARTPPTVMGHFDNLPMDPVRPSELRSERVDSPVRLAWQRESGYEAEWWITWNPPDRPADQLALLVREHSGGLEIAYVYRGPGTPGLASVAC